MKGRVKNPSDYAAEIANKTGVNRVVVLFIIKAYLFYLRVTLKQMTFRNHYYFKFFLNPHYLEPLTYREHRKFEKIVKGSDKVKAKKRYNNYERQQRNKRE